MSIANPFGLIGLLSIPVILALHLIRERKRRFVVSDLALWSFLDYQVRGPRPRRVPVTWLLILDLIVAALLSLALAQPRLDLALPVLNDRQLVIVLDRSTSMRAGEGLFDRFSQAKVEIAALLENLGPRDIATVVAFGRTAQWVGDSRQAGYEQLLASVEALQAGETGSAIQEALALGRASIDGTLPVEFYILTDGGLTDAAVAGLEAFPYPIRWHLIGTPADNQAILELNATPLGENRYRVFARIVNFGAQEVMRSLTLRLGEQVVDQISLSIPAGSSVPQVWQISVDPEQPGVGESAALTVALNGRDRLPQDDSASTGLQPGGNIQITLVAENPDSLQQAFLAVPRVDLQVLTPAEFIHSADRRSPDLTVLRGFVPETWPKGKTFLVEPPNDWRAAEGVTRTASVQRNVPTNAPLLFPNPDPLLIGVDFSGVRWSKAWSPVTFPEGFVILMQAGEMPLLLRGQSDLLGENTPLWVLLADLSHGNFTKHPAFPILMANLVESAAQSPLSGSLKTGETIWLPASNEARSWRIFAPGAAPVELEVDGPRQWTQTGEPGIYRFVHYGQDGRPVEFIAGINAGDEIESDLHLRVTEIALSNTAPGSDPAQGEQPVTGLNRTDQSRRQIDLLPWLLGVAILFLLLEARLAWRR